MNLEKAKIALHALKFAFGCIENASNDECAVVEHAIKVLEDAIAVNS